MHAKSTISSRLTELLQHPQMRTLATEQDLTNRLVGIGFSEPCTRCSGGGYFGPRSVHGGRCFKCGGRGTQPPRLTKKLEAEVREAVEAGKLEGYVRRRLEIAAARKAVKGKYEQVFSTYKDTAWCQHFYGPTGSGKVTKPGYPLAWKLVDKVTAAHDVAFDADSKIRLGRGDGNAVFTCLEAVAAYERALQTLDRAHARCLEQGLYEQATADYRVAKDQGYNAECACSARWGDVAAKIWEQVSE